MTQCSSNHFECFESKGFINKYSILHRYLMLFTLRSCTYSYIDIYTNNTLFFIILFRYIFSQIHYEKS